jgi:hypothetical protein
MQRWKTVLAPVLVFLLGMIAGGTLVGLVVAKRVRHLIDAGPAEIVSTAGNLVARKLDLDARQRRDLEPVLADLQAGFTRLRIANLPEVRRLILDAESRLRPGLRPGQQAKLDRLLAAPKARWQALVPETARPPSPAAP